MIWLKERARELYDQGKSLKNIALELGKPEGTIRTWKYRGRWDETPEMKRAFQKDETQRETNRKRKASVNRSIAKHVENNEELSDVEKDFCLYFIQTYNATQAAWSTNQYATRNNAKIGGWQMLQKPAVKAEIKRLKEMKRAGILADVDDLIELHMRIAFADLKDVALWTYDTKRKVNRVALLPSDQVDGQVVKEATETTTGVSIKLHDKTASMAFLERYFIANPMDKHKIEYDKAKLEMERKRQESAHPPTAEENDNLFEAITEAVKKQ